MTDIEIVAAEQSKKKEKLISEYKNILFRALSQVKGIKDPTYAAHGSAVRIRLAVMRIIEGLEE